MLFISVSMQRKIVAYQQLEHSDCGIVCIRIIARYWGKHMTLNEIRALADISREGMSIKGMRDTLYFKDDDSRLSFLQGNYVTLTNMSDHDVERIIKYRLSPINISNGRGVS